MVIDPIVFRGIELNLIVLIGGMSIFLGYRLFRIAVSTEGDFAGKGYGFSVSMKRIGPGVFFAFFGATVLVVAIVHTLQEAGVAAPGSSKAAAPTGNLVFFGQAGPSFIDTARAKQVTAEITFLSSLSPRTDLGEPQNTRSANAISVVSAFRPDILQCAFGAAKVLAYSQVKVAEAADPTHFEANVKPDDLKAYNEIKAFYAN